MNIKERTRLFKAFCDENRLRIIDHLAQGEHCACDLLDQLQISQSTLSHHMMILTDSGIVSSRRSGKWTYYRLDESSCDQAIDELRLCLTQKESQATPCGCEELPHATSRD